MNKNTDKIFDENFDFSYHKKYTPSDILNDINKGLVKKIRKDLNDKGLEYLPFTEPYKHKCLIMVDNYISTTLPVTFPCNDGTESTFILNKEQTAIHKVIEFIALLCREPNITTCLTQIFTYPKDGVIYSVEEAFLNYKMELLDDGSIVNPDKTIDKNELPKILGEMHSKPMIIYTIYDIGPMYNPVTFTPLKSFLISYKEIKND